MNGNAGGEPAKTGKIIARHVAPFTPIALALLMNAVPHASNTEATRAAKKPATEEAAFVQMCPGPDFPTDTPAAMDSEACGVAGNGGAETWQNEAKNNFCASGPARQITLDEMRALQSKVQSDSTIPFGNTRQHPLTSKAGPAKDRTPLEKLGEGDHVVLQGFVKIARQEGAESVNCGSHVPDDKENHDIHISIVSKPEDAECSGVVVEMNPHHRPSSWNTKNVEKLANLKLPVRVTGQLMFDSSHSPCVSGEAVGGDPARASLWEVHPIYQFDVCTTGTCSGEAGWTPLEAWKPE
jgi:hypothetical protein